ncbi:hypothetical protein [uncultured Draconibacterium sp.]|uniref:hypothetical protein n=1 Tax=uncultured Draconibacterium sp. TaxID=1573823 RepID=UPI002600881D|nr:hypothetical protein [uncultured Draconibacterium sp.]
MKYNKLIRAYFIPVWRGNLMENQKQYQIIRKDEKEDFISSHPSPKYYCDFELLGWDELGDCNFMEKIIYKMNIPSWILKLIYAVIIAGIGACVNSLFCKP